MTKNLVLWREELIRSVRSGFRPPLAANPFPVQPVLILAGTCKEECGEAWEIFIQTLEKKLSTFSGRVVSGGTYAGVCAELGRLSAETVQKKRNWTSVGYLPRRTPADLVDNRYDELVFTDGNTFSEIEPLQYWTDILAAGIRVEQIEFLRHGGGWLSDFEEKLAREIT